ncbi:MAG: MFS transporter [Neisseria sp.]|nr:MFS transporter [Neisseria sp.]
MPHPALSRHFTLLLIIAVMLLAANLRAPIIAVGPLAGLIQQDLRISSTVMGMIAALPVLTFALCSPFAARLGRRFGMEEVLIGALAVLAGGILLRTAGASLWWMLAGTVMLSAGIAMGNVLLSGIIKRSLPDKVGRVTTLYSLAMGVSAGVAGAAALPLAEVSNWQTALNVWLLPVSAALAVWLYMRRRNGHITTPAAAGAVRVSVWRSPLAWAISLLMGLQSLLFYTLAAWLPLMMAAKGVAAAQTGYYLLVFQLAGLPAVFTTTALAAKLDKAHHRWLMLAICLINAVSILALWRLSDGLLFWAGLAGFGASSIFTFCLLLFVARTDTAEEAAGLSGMAQSVGYLVAALGPVGAGWLFDLTQSWQWPMAVLFALMVVKLLLGWHCARPLTLSQAQAARAEKG